ncbi:hypothetical protein ILUMI_23099 [Ignelater luminosus]|uniref:Uncharacterized protein n=1 Tax=Ignelater luminosus TaxID=2038154 RepID=A0A8K0CCN5_IGNLU|nr:hypothetical protein ILUMI_23099 [Ignelater luminosus]
MRGINVFYYFLIFCSLPTKLYCIVNPQELSLKFLLCNGDIEKIMQTETIVCVFRRMGFLDSDGTINIEKYKILVRDVFGMCKIPVPNKKIVDEWFDKKCKGSKQSRFSVQVKNEYILKCAEKDILQWRKTVLSRNTKDDSDINKVLYHCVRFTSASVFT